VNSFVPCERLRGWLSRCKLQHQLPNLGAARASDLRHFRAEVIDLTRGVEWASEEVLVC
jgi:hypothetical protein